MADPLNYVLDVTARANRDQVTGEADFIVDTFSTVNRRLRDTIEPYSPFEQTLRFGESADEAERMSDALIEIDDELVDILLDAQEVDDEIKDLLRSSEEVGERIPAWEEALRKTFGVAARGFEEFNEDIEDTIIGIKDMLMGIGSSKPGLIAAAKSIGYVTATLTDWVSEGSTTLRIAEELEDATVKMAVGFGESAAQGMALSDTITDLVGATQYSTKEIIALAQGLAQSGLKLSEFSTDTQEAMVHLTHTFGMSATEVGKTVKSMEFFGSNLDNVLGSATAFQKGFKIPGIFQALPGLVSATTEDILTFGEEITGTADQANRATLQLAGVIAKAYGKTVPEAVGNAQQALKRFREGARTNADVFLGIGDDFDALTKTFMEMGMGMGEATGMMEGLASEDNLDTIVALSEKLQGLGPPGTFMYERYRRLLQKDLPAEIFGLINNQEKLNEALAGRDAMESFEQSVQGQGVAAFNEMGKQALDTTVEMRKMFKNVIELGQAYMNAAGLTKMMQDALKGARDRFVQWSQDIRDFIKSDKFQVWVERTKPIVVGVGKSLLVFGSILGGLITAVGTIATTMGAATRSFAMLKGATAGVMKPMASVSKLLLAPVTGAGTLLTRIPLLGRVLGGVATSTKLAAGGLGALGKRALKAVPFVGSAISVLSGVKAAAEEMGDTLQDETATGMEKAGALVRGGAVGVVSAFDAMLFGLPSMIGRVFGVDIVQAVGEGVGKMWDALTKWLGNPETVGEALGTIKDRIAVWLGDVADWLAREGPGLLDGFGKTVGSAMGGILKFIGELVVDAFYGIFGRGFSAAGEALDEGGPGLGEAVMRVIGSIGDLVLGAFKGMADGILGAFGTNLTILGAYFEMTWKTILFKAQSSFPVLYEVFASNVDRIRNIWITLKTMFEMTLVRMHERFEMVTGMIREVFEGNFKGIKVFALGIFRSLVDSVVEMLSSILSHFQSVFAAMQNVPLIGGAATKVANAIGSIQNKASETQAAFDNWVEKSLATGDRASKAEVDAIKNRADERIRGIKAEEAAERDRIAQAADARRRSKKELQEEYDADMARLSGVVDAEKRAMKTEKDRLQAAIQFRKQMNQVGIAAATQDFEREGKRQNLTRKQLDAGSQLIESYIKETSKSLAAKIKAGEITAAEAESEGIKARAEAVRRAMEEAQRIKEGRPMTPAEAKKKAAGEEPDAAARMTGLIERYGGRMTESRVTVTLQGGDSITRDLGRRAKVATENATGGRAP